MRTQRLIGQSCGVVLQPRRRRSQLRGCAQSALKRLRGFVPEATERGAGTFRTNRVRDQGGPRRIRRAPDPEPLRAPPSGQGPPAVPHLPRPREVPGPGPQPPAPKGEGAKAHVQGDSREFTIPWSVTSRSMISRSVIPRLRDAGSPKEKPGARPGFRSSGRSGLTARGGALRRRASRSRPGCRGGGPPRNRPPPARPCRGGSGPCRACPWT